MRFRSLQVLRAVAALGVVLFHISGNVSAYGWASIVLPHLSRYGDAGVDIFFIISGFVIAYGNHGKPRGFHSARTFMMARVARIVPLYWVLTLLFVALLEIVPNVFTHARLNFWNVVASFLFLPAINWAGIIAPVIDVGWTLNYEAWFYGVFAVAMCITRRPLVAVAAFFGLTSLLRFAPGSSVPFLFYTDPIVLEFVAGCGIGTYHAKGKGFSPRMSLAILFGVLAVMLLYGPMLNNNRIIVSGVPALALVISVLALESKIRWSRFLCNLGDASYSLYLTQVFSVPFTLKLLQMIDRQRLLAGDLVSVVVTIVAIAAGFACHELVERPGMRLTNRR